jgi:hypothetical protein
MSDAFDGTRKGDGEPTFRAPLIMIGLMLAILVVLLLLASGALRDSGSDVPLGPVSSAELQSP